MEPGTGFHRRNNKHYVRTIEDLKERGGRSSGYAGICADTSIGPPNTTRMSRFGCGEFLFPYETGAAGKEREVIYRHGPPIAWLPAGGLVRYPSLQSILAPGFSTQRWGAEEHREAYEILVEIFAPIAAVF